MSVTHGQFGYSTIHGSETLRLPRVTRLQDSQDSETPDTPREHDVTHWRKTANVGICCGYWCRHNSKGCSKAVWLHISLRDAFCVISYSRREEIPMCKPPPLALWWWYALVDLKLRFHIFHKWIIINHICMEGHTKQSLGNARTSSILIVAKESHESSTHSV